MRTGVVVGYNGDITEQLAGQLVERLEHRFPGVAFAVVPWGASVAFQYDPEPFDLPSTYRSQS